MRKGDVRLAVEHCCGVDFHERVACIVGGDL